MTIQSIISRIKGGGREDGYIVYCVSCRDPICRTTINLGKVKCELCQRVENGEVLSAEAVQRYRASKIEIMGVTGVRVPPPEDLDKEKQLNPIRSMGNGFIRAMGFKKDEEVSKAREVAEEKQRRRLFEERNLEADLGSMEEVDSELEDETK
jgi:hypothetical protein